MISSFMFLFAGMQVGYTADWQDLFRKNQLAERIDFFLYPTRCRKAFSDFLLFEVV